MTDAHDHRGETVRYLADFECMVLYEEGDDTSGRRCVTAQSMLLHGSPAPHPMVEVVAAVALAEQSALTDRAIKAGEDLNKACEGWKELLREALQRAEEAQKAADGWKRDCYEQIDHKTEALGKLAAAQKEVERLRTSNTALLTANAIIQQDGIARNDRLQAAEKEVERLRGLCADWEKDVYVRDGELKTAEARAARMREVVEAAKELEQDPAREREHLPRLFKALAALEGK